MVISMKENGKRIKLMVKVTTSIQTGLNIKEAGNKTSNMVGEKKLGLMVRILKGFIKMERK
jgi:hypothetical protein